MDTGKTQERRDDVPQGGEVLRIFDAPLPSFRNTRKPVTSYKPCIRRDTARTISGIVVGPRPQPRLILRAISAAGRHSKFSFADVERSFGHLIMPSTRVRQALLPQVRLDTSQGTRRTHHRTSSRRLVSRHKSNMSKNRA